MNTAQLEIKHCKDCPFSEQKRRYTSDSWEELYDWHCKKHFSQLIESHVAWNEVKHITIPDWCPLIPNP